MEERIKKIVSILDDKKAENIEAIDLRDKEYMVDYCVIATTLNAKHGFALLNYLKDGLKPEETFVRVDEDDDWTIIDFGDVLVHLMSEKYREKYSLEKFLSELEKRA